MRQEGGTGAKRALLVLVAILLLGSFIGSSGAYFSDSQVLPGNSIRTGTWITPPRVFSCCPCIALLGICAHVKVSGQGFQPGAVVELVQGAAVIPASCVQVISGRTITCSFNLWGAACGGYDVRVTNPDGGAGMLVGGFTIVLSLGDILNDVGEGVTGLVTVITGSGDAPPAAPGAELTAEEVNPPSAPIDVPEGKPAPAPAQAPIDQPSEIIKK